jgi:nucleoside-diphosphate-sugar epimerase
MRYAIFGATGAVGKALARELASAKQEFRVVGRSLETLKHHFSKFEPLVEYAAADLSLPEQARTAALGVDAIFYVVGVPYTQFAQHPVLTRNALAAAKAAGARQFIHLSTVYPFGLPRTSLVDENHPRDPHTFKGRMRKEQEDIVLAVDGGEGLRTTILRAPDFYGADSELSYVASVFKAAVNGGRAYVIGPVDTPHEFVYAPDVANTLLELSKREQAYGSAWNLGGPAHITEREFINKVFASAGRKPSSFASGSTMLRIMGIFNPMMREIAEMQYLFSTPVLLNDSRLRTLIPDLVKTSYDDGIRETLNELIKRKGKA